MSPAPAARLMPGASISSTAASSSTTSTAGFAPGPSADTRFSNSPIQQFHRGVAMRVNVYAEEMTDQQMLWRAALVRPENDPAQVERDLAAIALVAASLSAGPECRWNPSGTRSACGSALAMIRRPTFRKGTRRPAPVAATTAPGLMTSGMASGSLCPTPESRGFRAMPSKERRGKSPTGGSDSGRKGPRHRWSGYSARGSRFKSPESGS